MRQALLRQVRLPLIASAAVVATACASDTPLSPRARDTAPTFGQVQQDLRGLYVVEAKGATAELLAAIRHAGGVVRANVPQIRMVTVAGLDGKRAALLAKRSDVVGVYHDAMTRFALPTPVGVPRRALSTVRPNSLDQSGAYFYPAQWNLPITSTNQAWLQTSGGTGRTVWVLDTGIDPNQLDRAGQTPCYTTGISVPRYQSDQTELDYHFHGTFVSSLISSNGIGNASVAPGARVCTRKVLSEDGAGTWGDLIAAIVYAADFGANVINMSLGGYFDRYSEGAGSLLRMLQASVDFANMKGTVVVASAGNSAIDLDHDGPSLISVPAQLERVISVGATGPDLSFNYDALASYSNYGGETGIDLVAPGGDQPDPNNVFDLILSACSSFVCGGTNYYVLSAGTSFSAPHVSATAAIVQGMLGGAPSPAAVEACIRANTDAVGKVTIFGSGRLNVLKAGLCGGGDT